jgi:hypothetical protein
MSERKIGAETISPGTMTTTKEPTQGKQMTAAGKSFEERFLIIAGTSKAGTTSVFNYLARHPQICPAHKETRFFLDVSYPLSSKKRYQKDGPAVYLSLFESTGRQKEDNWRFEATPDYLYSENTADRIRQTLPNVRLMFILREPVSRLLSWYRFARRCGEIPARMTFDNYVEIQKSNQHNYIAQHPALSALQHGRYSLYLKRYLDLFERSAIDIRFYEDLARDPSAFMRSICVSCYLDASYFQDYRFEIVNKGSDVKSRRLHYLYQKGKRGLRKFVRGAPAARRWMKGINGKVERLYGTLNVLPTSDVTMSARTKQFLISYYENESDELAGLFGVWAPWPKRQ